MASGTVLERDEEPPPNIDSRRRNIGIPQPSRTLVIVDVVGHGVGRRRRAESIPAQS